MMTSEAAIGAAKTLVHQAPYQLSAHVTPGQMMELHHEKVVKGALGVAAVESGEFQGYRRNGFGVIKRAVVEVSAVE